MKPHYTYLVALALLSLSAARIACRTTPSAGTASDPATQLAERVHRAAGGDRYAEVKELKFKFVVYEGGEKRFVADHRWDIERARDRVLWKDKTGVERDAIIDLGTNKAEGKIDGKKAEGPDREELAKKAYARWVNDTYWLILPLKLLDPGVHRTLEPQREYGGKKYDVLKLSFDHVGLTPGDQYWLFINPATAHIERWEMLLEGSKPPPEANSFTDYRAVGPLMLALDHL